MFDIGFQELAVIVIVGLLVVGPEKLPELGRTAGKWMTELRRGISAVRMQVDREFREIDAGDGRHAQHLFRGSNAEAAARQTGTAETARAEYDITGRKGDE